MRSFSLTFVMVLGLLLLPLCAAADGAENGDFSLQADTQASAEALIRAQEAAYDHYRAALDAAAPGDVRRALNALELSIKGGFEEISIEDGCQAALTCHDGSTISCACPTPFGTCHHNASANAWGGSVTCSCSGTTWTQACAPCQLATPAYISGPDLCQGRIETYQTNSVSGATNYRWEIVSTPIVRNTSTPIVSLSGHYFHVLPVGHYIIRVRAENSQCVSGWRSANLIIRANGDPLCTICDHGDRVCF
ncbi:MAG: hypothetical protein AAF772_03400 [Acidobacteriota bacterium]